MSQRRNVNQSDCLKKLGEICDPDARHKDIQIFDQKSREMRSLIIDDFYQDAEKLQLHADVPDEVFIQFEKVRNLYL